MIRFVGVVRNPEIEQDVDMLGDFFSRLYKNIGIKKKLFFSCFVLFLNHNCGCL